MNVTNCTLQSLLKPFPSVSFHTVTINSCDSEDAKATVANAIGQGPNHVWLANIDGNHWVPVWKQPNTTVQMCTFTVVFILQVAHLLYTAVCSATMTRELPYDIPR
jgi:hypothetical protein